jgi:hypothetical protein
MVNVSEATTVIILKIEPSRVPGRLRKYTSFDISISGITEEVHGLYSWQLKVNWTDANFEFVSAQQGPFLKKDGAETYWVPPKVDKGAVNETVLLGCTTLGTGGVIGSGVLATVVINVTNVVVGAKFDIFGIELRNRLGLPIKPPDYDVLIQDQLGEFAEARYYDINFPFGMVDIFDLITVGLNYGRTGTPGWIDEDVIKDGIINVQDLAEVASNYGPYTV